MQCKEWDDANSELFKESHDEAVHKISYESKLYELISASLGLTALRAEGCGIAAFGGDEYVVSATGFPFVPSLLHDKEAITKAPSLPGPVLSFISVRLSVCG